MDEEFQKWWDSQFKGFINKIREQANLRQGHYEWAKAGWDAALALSNKQSNEVSNYPLYEPNNMKNNEGKTTIRPMPNEPTQNPSPHRYARGLFDADGKQVGQETSPTSDGPWTKP